MVFLCINVNTIVNLFLYNKLYTKGKIHHYYCPHLACDGLTWKYLCRL